VTHAMEQLAAALRERGLEANLISGPGPVRMRVLNPAARMMSETVIAHAGAFWWPWRDQIAPVADITVAAGLIVRVLATIGS
jgi:ABC-type uncharacterized transport system permease subunit